jgi:cell division protein FtsL
MLGSVYLHTVAAGLTERVDELEAKNAKTSVEGEKLAVEVAKTSSPDRILELARHELGMRDPDGKALKVYGKTGEDVPPYGGEQAKEEAE